MKSKHVMAAAAAAAVFSWSFSVGAASATEDHYYRWQDGNGKYTYSDKSRKMQDGVVIVTGESGSSEPIIKDNTYTPNVIDFTGMSLDEQRIALQKRLLDTQSEAAKNQKAQEQRIRDENCRAAKVNLEIAQNQPAPKDDAGIENRERILQSYEQNVQTYCSPAPAAPSAGQ